MKKAKIVVSLISLNQLHHLERLLPTLVQAIDSIDAQVRIVANKCNDNTIEFIQTNYPDMIVTVNDETTGYGGNHNINLRQSDSDYFLIMNSDMLLAQNSISKLCSFMEKNSDVGIVGPKALNEDGSIQHLNKSYPSIFDLFLRMFCPAILKRFFRKRLDRYEMKHIGYDNIVDVPLLSGSFMFCRTKLLNQLNGFDERYFLYFEDYDLCRRMQGNGFRTVFNPEAEVIHFWERDAHKKLKYLMFFVNSAFRYFNNWGWKLF